MSNLLKLLPTTLVVAFSLAVAGCGDDDTTGGGPADTTPPAVASVTSVDVNHVEVTYDENVQRGSAEDVSNYLIVETSTPSNMDRPEFAPGDTLIIWGAALASDQRTVSLTTGDQGNAPYELSVAGVRDASGNEIGTAVVRAFTGTTAADVTAPELVYRSPGPNATGVPVGVVITLVFTEPITAPSFFGGTTLSSGAGTVPYGADSDDEGIHITMMPSSLLELGTEYTITLSGLQDAAGNTMADVSWSFTTTNSPDVTPPQVVSSIPAHNATNVSVNTVLSLTFSEAVNQVALEVSLYPEVGDGDIAWSNAGKTITFTPYVPLLDDQQYTLTIAPDGVKDLSGNGNQNVVTIRFSTGSAFATGSIAGTISGDPTSDFADDPTGALVVATVGGFFEDFVIAGNTTVAGNNTYDMRNLADGSFGVLAIMDSNLDDVLDPNLGDAIGAYGVDFSIFDLDPDSVTIAGGNRVTGVDFQLFDFSSIAGTVSYSGAYAAESHFVGVGLFDVVGFDPLNPPDYATDAQWPDFVDWSFPSIAFGYPDGSYYVGAFLDANGNFAYDPATDPAGFYGGFPPTAINVQNGSDANGIVIPILDPPTAATSSPAVAWLAHKKRDVPAWFGQLAKEVETSPPAPKW